MTRGETWLKLDAYMDTDPKIKKLIRKTGNEGVGVFLRLVCLLRRETDHRYPLEIEDLAFDLNAEEELILKIIKDFELFKFSDTHFWSERLNRDMEHAERSRVNGMRGALVRLKHVKREDLKGLSDAEVVEIHKHATGLQLSLIHI